jgi:nucleoside-diphosphate-sugar epimerase
MSIVITGATGQLGRLVVKQLMAGGTPPDKIVATGRDIAKVTALSGDGLTVRRADFAEPENSDGRVCWRRDAAARLDANGGRAVRQSPQRHRRGARRRGIADSHAAMTASDLLRVSGPFDL